MLHRKLVNCHFEIKMFLKTVSLLIHFVNVNSEGKLEEEIE